MQDQTNSIFGLDLSHYNTVTDWNQVKSSGAQFAYQKATQGTGFTDPQFVNYAQGLKSIGIPVGAYHYAGLGDPVAEANHFKSVIDPLNLECKPVLDLEESASGVDLVQWVRTFRDTLGCDMILYTGNWFIEANPDLNQLSDIPLWTSYYKQTAPPDEPGWSTWTIWQYSDKATIPGIDGLVDVDYGVSLDKILKVVPKQPTIDDYTREAINILAKKGYINSPQIWLDDLANGGANLGKLAVLLLDKVAK